ncbi:CMP/dCMP deaminase (fragment) [Candidatus Desulfosporosinus infrequens]|uniref:CMP/dCMP deaminase n=1 Tax=Candidatus Desulfosporosinus infrequens TaxID=2043169 RepID=A0A2U3LGU1_9FIRM
MNYFDEARKLLPCSNCLKRRYACVIVLHGQIISKGWNTSPTTCVTCSRLDIEHNVGDYAECSSVHAEQMALINARESLEGAELYLVCADEVDPIPCPTCAKLMDFYGVKLVREVQNENGTINKPYGS